MLEIKRDMIYITKGDSAVLHVKLSTADGSDYAMLTGDKLILTVRSRIGGGVLMAVESTTPDIKLTPEDTKKLAVGNCFYDIELRTASGMVYTVVGVKTSTLANMVVYPEVTE